MSEVPAGEPFYGSVSVYESPVGMEFTVLDAAPHKISGTYLNQKDAVWLFVIIKGSEKPSQITLSSWARGYCMGLAGLTRRLAFLRTSRQCMFDPAYFDSGYFAVLNEGRSLRASTGLTGFFSRLLVYLAETLKIYRQKS